MRFVELEIKAFGWSWRGGGKSQSCQQTSSMGLRDYRTPSRNTIDSRCQHSTIATKYGEFSLHTSFSFYYYRQNDRFIEYTETDKRNKMHWLFN